VPVDGRIAPRSGLASKNFIDTGAGVIDADYRGQVKVLLFNHAETEFKIKTGDRIAQLVLERVCSQILRSVLQANSEHLDLHPGCSRSRELRRERERSRRLREYRMNSIRLDLLSSGLVHCKLLISG
jgi:hypothetical protein